MNNDRFKSEDEKPKPKQELPEGKQAKCALAYSILFENLVKDGVSEDDAESMATDVVTTVLEATIAAEKAARQNYRIHSTIFNN